MREYKSTLQTKNNDSGGSGRRGNDSTTGTGMNDVVLLLIFNHW